MVFRCSWEVISIEGGVELSIDEGSEPEDIVDDTEDADGKDTPEELLDVDDEDDVALVQLHTLDDDAMDSADDKEAASEEDMLMLLDMAVGIPTIGLLPI